MEDDPFRAPLGISSGHAQTLMAGLCPRLPAPLPPAEDRLVAAGEDTRLRVQVHYAADRAADTVLVVVHGLAGSSASRHTLDITRQALARGVHVVRMNMRNCGGTEALTPTLYHGNLPGDLHAVVGAALSLPLARRVVLAGYSMGGDLVLNALAAWGDRAPAQVAGAFVVCPTLDARRSVALVDGPGGVLYRRHYLRDLHRFYRRKAALFGEARFPLARLRGATSIRAYDAAISAPFWGFAGADDYYRWVSSTPRLAAVRVPTIVLHADDDPIAVVPPEARAILRGHPFLALVETRGGGHCGFVEVPSRRRPDGRWAPHHVACFAAGCW
jgi:predicted alpha/beta-fold hydrolase